MTGTYPNAPGWKGASDTGREAAAAMKDKMGLLQRRVHTVLTERREQGATPEEAADLLGLDRVSAQPRFSELKAKGLIVDSGLRRRNLSSGKRAVVWVLREYASETGGAA